MGYYCDECHHLEHDGMCKKIISTRTVYSLCGADETENRCHCVVWLANKENIK